MLGWWNLQPIISPLPRGFMDDDTSHCEARDWMDRASVTIDLLRSALKTQAMRSFPQKTHKEIDAEIDRILAGEEPVYPPENESVPTDRLLACPFCASEDLMVDVYDMQPDDHHNGFVQCANCGVQGPTAKDMSKTHQDAEVAVIKIWNTRRQP